MCAVGDFLRSIDDPSTVAQLASESGYSVAMDANRIIVGAPAADTAGLDGVGLAHIYDQATGSLLATLANPNPAPGDRFGHAVAISGQLAVVGAHRDDTGGTDSGAAYVFDVNTGSLVATLANPTPASFDFFGFSVAISGDTVVVSAYLDDTAASDAGAVYRFDATTGELRGTLTKPSAAPFDHFGYDIALSADTIVVGTRNDDASARDAGAVLLFATATGGYTRRIDNPTPADFDYFGHAVDIASDRVVVGAYRDDLVTVDAGAVHVFDRPSGSLVQSIANPSPGSFDNFGFAVSVAGDTVVAGAYRDDAGAMDAGSAYQFNATTGVLQRTLANPAPNAFDYYGSAVALSENAILVGAYWDDTGAFDAGTAYQFDPLSGSLVRALINPTPSAFDYFGYAVALSGRHIVSGAYLEDTGATDAGAVYVHAGPSGTIERKFNNPTPAPFDNFGHAVAASENFVVVGAHRDDTGATDAGAAYVYDVAIGSLVQTITNPTPDRLDYFGFAVAISGNTVVVGADRDDTGAVDSGVVYLFDIPTGALLHTLVNPTPGTGDHFGLSVAISGNFVVVGAFNDDELAEDSGVVHVFDATSGRLLRTVNNPAPDEADRFGQAVAISGTTIVASAPLDDLRAPDAGTVYSFDTTTGSLVHTLTSPNPNSLDFFGTSVAVTANVVVVGAFLDDTQVLNGGAAYVFDGLGGTFLRSITGPVATGFDNFGFSVAAGTDLIAVGAPLVDGSTSDRGAVYVHDGLPNTPPHAVPGGPYLGAEGTSIVLDAAASSDGQDPPAGLLFAWDLDYDGVTFDTDVSGVSPSVLFPDDFATRTMAVRVTDSSGASVIATTTVEIVNVPPSVTTSSLEIVTLEGESAMNSGMFGDPGADAVTLTASVGTIVDHGDGTWTWSRTALDGPDDSQTVTITAADSDGAIGSTTFDWVVENNIPRITADQESLAVLAGSVAGNSGSFADPGADAVTLLASIGEVMDRGNGTWSWSFPSGGEVGMTQPVTVTATDSDGAVSSVNFTLLTTNIVADRSTVPIGPGEIPNNGGSFLMLPGAALLTASVGTVNENGNQTWSWSLGREATAGDSQPVTINIQFGNGDIGSVTFELIVSPPVPGVTADLASVSTSEGALATNRGTFQGAPGEVLTLSASAGEIIDVGNGTWNWSHKANDGPDDTQTVTVTVTSNYGISNSVSFAMEVRNVPPRLVVLDDAVTVGEGAIATNAGTFGDLGQDQVTLFASVGTVVDNGDQTWSWTLPTVAGTDDSRTVTITATDTDGAVTDVSFELVDLAGIEKVSIGDGTAQRSIVSQLQVMFNTVVDIESNAFLVEKTGHRGGTVMTRFTTQAVAGKTIATIEFGGRFTEAATGSLIDGNYRLTIVGSRIRRAGTNIAIDADGDGVPGGNYSLGDQAVDAFFRWFGDINGNGRVDIDDRSAFDATFRKMVGEVGFDARFDVNADGFINHLDRRRFLRLLARNRDDVDHRGTLSMGQRN